MAKRGVYSVKKEIIKAFIELLSQKSYMDITVTDLVNEAKVARVSFYRNFNSLSDVIDAIADSLSQDFTADVLPILTCSDERRWRDFLLKYFSWFSSHYKKLSTVSFQNISAILMRIDNRIQRDELVRSVGTPEDKYLAFGKLGLVNNIVKKWLDEGMKETPEEMTDYIMSFITSF